MSESQEVDNSKMYISYNHVHMLCQEAAAKIKQYKPDLIVAIGGGGFIPARILRSFLKEPGEPNLRVMAIILSLYEDINSVSTSAENVGTEVVRVQWIDYKESGIDLIGKKVLVVDEVDDTRTTLHYAIDELAKDAKEQAKEKGLEDPKTEFSIFVLHDKIKPKKADLPKEIMDNRYFAARTVEDCWIAYPWESTDIVTHTRNAVAQGNDIIN
ncbi:unnamed protein product [[Candida] boidinii]|uniref:Unnamed protein product n=1 Tax=Candida boidinii TaxID=5477 RepID=A0A9W6SWN6_CANBO|nr:hypothetical protein BVG19_g1460 [[Candida] boidinii]OWB51037.1 hypothetical protein B5S27_g2594 [[Candida] boidinii]OWB69955.1 hypothetical protein B5S30_g5395 [[Candida] boidinii]OWB86765.1 hypothetical protein B5S33_g5477 [[Candida] boidinii]GME67671.1 unnamed protein product [[Candida] boidinii]